MFQFLNNNQLTFDVYTSANTDIFVLNESQHPYSQEPSFLRFLLNRIISFPTSKQAYNRVIEYINKFAVYSGYPNDTVINLVRKLKFKKCLETSSTLSTTFDLTQNCLDSYFI